MLCLLASPHSRLYVEVDAVQGCEPKEVALQKLRDFLSAYCTKPDGVEIVRSDVIPVEAARGSSPHALARKYINGTGWKDWGCIDTLAAAYAEAGDFKRALDFQEQALRTGSPTESEQKDMRDRLSLYKQSRRFREKPAKP